MTDGREYPARPIVGVGAVVLVEPEDAGRIDWSSAAPACGVLLVRRRFAPLAGEWSLPGGALEVGETLDAGIAREVLEETGLSIRVGPAVEAFDRIVFDDDRRVRYHFVLIDYLCRPLAGALGAGSDVSEIVIADPLRLAPFELASKTLEVIDRALALARRGLE